jgi:7-keto-8-aminopelargonate synthetase-like enzyme
MNYNKFYHRFSLDKSIVNRIGFNPYYIEIQSGLDNEIIIDGQRFINLASNNYLGLANNNEVIDEIVKSVNKYGASLCGTPISTGFVDLYKLTENKLSHFLNLEETIIFPSCYQANNGIFLTIANRDDLILIDRYAHSSLVQGAASVKCKIRPFLHNNLEHLEGILKNSSKFSQVFIVTESVFSTDGTIAPFDGIVELSNKYGAIPIIDDSHGIGVIGNTGKGILEHAGINNFEGIYTASLGKGFANFGGIISGKSNLIEYLKYYCPHFVYSTAVPPSVLAGINKVIDIITAGYSNIKKNMDNNKNIIYKALKCSNFEVVESQTPINAIKSKSMENTFEITKRMFKRGILTTPFVEPSVPINDGKVRIIAGANISKEIINKASDLILEEFVK